MKALVGAFNQEKALVGAFSVIVKTDLRPDIRAARQVTWSHRPARCSIGTKRNAPRFKSELFRLAKHMASRHKSKAVESSSKVRVVN